MIKLNDKNDLKRLRTLVEERLSPLGMKFQVGNITYAPDGTEATLKVTVVAEGAPVLDRYEKALKDYAHILTYSLGEGFAEKVFKRNGQDCSVTGYMPRARRNEFIYTVLKTGQRYRIDREDLKRVLR